MLPDIESCGAYSEAECAQLMTALNDNRRAFNRDVPSCLLHMDIWAENILVDSFGNITGITDWEPGALGDKETNLIYRAPLAQ